jgi:small subunit ribosomal protein S11
MAKAQAKAKAGKKKSFKKREKKSVPVGVVYVQASFNNTIVTFTDPVGNVLC